MNKTFIAPTIGRVVLFQPAHVPEAEHSAQPWPALICYVHSDRCINVAAFDENGNNFPASSVPLLQDGDEKPAAGYFAEWMPYQKGQAAKTDALLQAQAQNGTLVGTQPGENACAGGGNCGQCSEPGTLGGPVGAAVGDQPDSAVQAQPV